MGGRPACVWADRFLLSYLCDAYLTRAEACAAGFYARSFRLSDVRQSATCGRHRDDEHPYRWSGEEKNILRQAHGRLQGETTMRYKRDTRPIVIIARPQSAETPQSQGCGCLSISAVSAPQRFCAYPILFRLKMVRAFKTAFFTCPSESEEEKGVKKLDAASLRRRNPLRIFHIYR